MTSRKQTKRRGSGQQKNISLELAKSRKLNERLIGQLIVVSNDPESERSKAIIEHYRNVLTQMKNDTTINSYSNSTGETDAIRNAAEGTEQSDKAE